MAESYLTMLNLAANVTQQAFASMDQSMTQTLAARQNIQNGIVDSAEKAIQFAQRERENNARIAELNIRNEMEARKLSMAEELFPLRKQQAILEMEEAKNRMKIESFKATNAAFEALTDPYIESIGYDIISKQNVPYAQEIAEFQDKAKAWMASGQPFEANKYAAKLNEIKSKYADVQPEAYKGYDPAVAAVLGHVSPKLQKEYAKQNPVEQSRAWGLAANVLSADDENYTKTANILNTVFNPEQMAQLHMLKQAIDNNNDAIKSDIKVLDNKRMALNDRVSSESNPKDYARMVAEVKELEREISKKQKQNKDIFMNVMARKLELPNDVSVSATGGKVQGMPDLSRKDLGKRDFGLPNNEETEPTVRLLNKVDKYVSPSGQSFLSQRLHLEGVDKIDDELYKDIYNVISHTVATDNSGRFNNPGMIGKILLDIKEPIRIPIMGGLLAQYAQPNILGISVGGALVTPPAATHMSIGGREKGIGAGDISSISDINKILERVPQEYIPIVKKELVATLSAAAVKYAFDNKHKQNTYNKNAQPLFPQ